MARINSKRVKIGGMNQLMIDLKPRRCDADVFINTPIDVTNLVDYVNKRKKKGDKITYFHAFLLALAKTIYNRPKLNRYVKNRHMYEHTNVSISFVAKVEFEDDSEEVMLIIDVAPDDNIIALERINIEILKDNIRVCKAKGNAMSACFAFLLYGTNDGDHAKNVITNYNGTTKTARISVTYAWVYIRILECGITHPRIYNNG